MRFRPHPGQLSATHVPVCTISAVPVGILADTRQATAAGGVGDGVSDSAAIAGVCGSAAAPVDTGDVLCRLQISRGGMLPDATPSLIQTV